MRTFDLSLRETHPTSSGSVSAPPADHLSHLHSAPQLGEREGFLQPQPDRLLTNKDDEDKNTAGKIQTLGNFEEYFCG